MIQYIIAFLLLLVSSYVYYKLFITKKQSSNRKKIDGTYTLVGITGRKRSGKDTIGKYLAENYGFIQLAYADTLKEVCKIVFGLSDEQLYGNKEKETVDEYWKHTPREILQKVGTELFRNTLPKELNNIEKDIWIRSIEKTIMNYIKDGHNKFVITDVRFQNELDFIKNNNGIMIKVVRPFNTNDRHASETMIDHFATDIILPNCGDITDLHNMIEHEIKYNNSIKNIMS